MKHEFMHPATKLIEATCEECKEKFYAKTHAKKHCSQKCYLRMYQRKHYYALDEKRRAYLKKKNCLTLG